MSCYIHNLLKNWTSTCPYTSDPKNDRIAYHCWTSLSRPQDAFADREKNRILNIEKLQNVRGHTLTWYIHTIVFLILNYFWRSFLTMKYYRFMSKFLRLKFRYRLTNASMQNKSVNHLQQKQNTSGNWRSCNKCLLPE